LFSAKAPTIWLSSRVLPSRPEFPRVDEYFRCVADKSDRKIFSSKAKFRVWMASHSDYELYVGEAATEGCIPWASPAFDLLKEFLRQL